MSINCKKWRNIIRRARVDLDHCNVLFQAHSQKRSNKFEGIKIQYKELLARLKDSSFYFNDEFRTISSGDKVRLREPGQGEKEGEEVILNIRKKQYMEDGTVVKVGDKLEEIIQFPRIKQTIEVIGFTLDNDHIIIKALVGNPVKLVEIRDIGFDGVGEGKRFRKI